MSDHRYVPAGRRGDGAFMNTAMELAAIPCDLSRVMVDDEGRPFSADEKARLELAFVAGAKAKKTAAYCELSFWGDTGKISVRLSPPALRAALFRLWPICVALNPELAEDAPGKAARP